MNKTLQLNKIPLQLIDDKYFNEISEHIDLDFEDMKMFMIVELNINALLFRELNTIQKINKNDVDNVQYALSYLNTIYTEQLDDFYYKSYPLSNDFLTYFTYKLFAVTYLKYRLIELLLTKIDKSVYPTIYKKIKHQNPLNKIQKYINEINFYQYLNSKLEPNMPINTITDILKYKNQAMKGGYSLITKPTKGGRRYTRNAIKGGNRTIKGGRRYTRRFH